MDSIPTADDFRVDIGRADKGRTFVRVVHLPTGKERIVVGLGEATAMEVAARLTQELSDELAGSPSPPGTKNEKDRHIQNGRM